jgi:hypothetical protein
VKKMSPTVSWIVAGFLLSLMAVLAGGAALRESVTVDEVAHIGAGVSYLQKFDLRLNEEHPPLAKILAALPLVLRGTHADYSHISWTISEKFIAAFLGEWVFGEYLLTKWNDPVATLAWARLPMLLLTLMLGLVVYLCARRLGGEPGGILCLSIYVCMPAFLAFGTLVHTDIAITLFSLLTIWRYAAIWENPGKRNILSFALCFAGALLSKFTAGLLFFVFIAFVLSMRWRPLPGQPTEKTELRAWRRARRRATFQGIFVAAAVVYVFYFIFSIRQSTDALNLVGHGPLAVPLRRLLMPPWLYVRGVLMVLVTSSRPTFILGHAYPHGVWFYYPTIFMLKSPLGFLGLLLVALVVALVLHGTRRTELHASIIPTELAGHWRVLWVSLLVFTIFCMISRLDMSIRHFTIPIVLLILMLSRLPRMVGQLRLVSLSLARVAAALTVVLTLSCFFVAIRAYPFFFPFINSLSFGHPAYALMNDSNVDWNQSLPEAMRYAKQRGMQKIKLDYYAFDDAVATYPQVEVWNCQTPVVSDAGQWVIVSANLILDGHNCPWLMHYSHELLAGGSMYAVHLPERIPEAGSAAGPPLPSAFRQIAGAPFDSRGYFLNVLRDPQRLPQVVAFMEEEFEASKKSKR